MIAAAGRALRTAAVVLRGWGVAAGVAMATTAVVVEVALAVLMSAALPAPAQAAFGDGFGVVPINGHPEAVESVPAYPGDEAFWGGVCERAAMPAPGMPIGPSGVGVSPSSVFAPMRTGGSPYHVEVAAPEIPAHCVDWAAPFPAGAGLESWVVEPGWRLGAVTQAGAHPDATTTLALRRIPAGETAAGTTDGHVDNILVEVPAGFVGNPQAVAECPAEVFAVRPTRCPPQSQVGVLNLHMQASGAGGDNFGGAWDAIYPVWNLEPRHGRVAELGFAYASGEKATTVRLVARVRTSSDFGVTAFAGQIPASLPLSSQSITLWGIPWAAENDLWRAMPDLVPDTHVCATQPETGTTPHYIPPGGLAPNCQARYEPGWGPIRPFLVNETDCNPAPAADLWMDSYQNPGSFDSNGDPDPADGDWVRSSSVSPAVTGCEKLGFDPDLQLEPTSTLADGPSGLSARLQLPQNDVPPAAVAHDPGDALDPDAGAPGHWRSDAGLATAHLKDTVVSLPAGVSVNPSSAAGLVGCSDAQMGVRGFDTALGRPVFNDGDPFDGDLSDGECPQESIIGTAKVETPLLAEDLDGELVLGTPRSTDPASGEMLRLFVVVRSRERGLVAKVFGQTVADPATGQLTTRFANNPEVPFDAIELNVTGGDRGMLALPQRCATYPWSSRFTPWSSVGAPAGTVGDATRTGGIATTADCSFGFAPSLRAGVSTKQARSSGAMTFRLTRLQGQQWLRRLDGELPAGLLASVRDVPLCSDAQAAGGACPAGSRIGSVDAAAGSGDPFWLERKGDVYLTDGYKGAPYGLLFRVPVEAGPFRGALALSPITVRAALQVDRTTAAVTAVSDPLPLVHHGIPLRTREMIVRIDRPNFVLTPSDCTPKEIAATATSAQGTVARPTRPFQVAGCADLPFAPKLNLRLTGRRQVTTGRHPGVRALVRQKGIGEAGIRRAQVILPKTLALDPANAQALCEFDDGTRPDLEDHCPRGSIVGRARATSPLLNRPLSGPVFFVKNIRIDPDTGNQIRTLPMIVAALRGEIAINLQGDSSVKRNRLVTTFAQVPDAPVGRFAMRIAGGRNGILAVTRTRRSTINICRRRQTAIARMHGHNRRTHHRRTRLHTPCPKPRRARRCTKRRKHTKACKRAAAKRNAAQRRKRR